MIEFKVAKKEDAQLVFDLTKQSFAHYAHSPFFNTTPSLLEDYEDVKVDIIKKEVLIAYIGEKAVGSVRYYPLKEGDFYLMRLGVLSQYRNFDIGEALIKEVERRAKAKGAERIILRSPYELKGLLNFYQRLGYRIGEISQDEDYARAKLIKKI